MVSLEEHIRGLAQRGQLRHLLVTKDPSGRGYQASFQARDAGYTVDIRRDPLDAIAVATGYCSVLEMNLGERHDRELAEWQDRGGDDEDDGLDAMSLV